MQSDLTYKVICFNDEVSSDEMIDWACEMLELGYDSEHLLILARVQKPSTVYEVKDYLKKAIEELGLKIKTGEEALISFASYYIKKISNQENIRQSLAIIKDFCIANDYDSIVYDFYNLHWAWEDIDYDDGYPTGHWNGGTKSNIKSITLNVAKEWLKKHHDKIQLYKSA